MNATQNQVTEPAQGRVTPATTVRHAGRHLFMHGWIQGAYYDATSDSPTPPCCLVGAISIVCYGSPVDAPAQHFDHPAFDQFEQAVAYLDVFLGERYGQDVYSFNDTRGRTVVDVLLAIIAAADAYDAKHPDTTDDPAAVPHADYPHLPGTLYDCPACESVCYCGFKGNTLMSCVHCAGQTEAAEECWISQRGTASTQALDAIERDGYGHGGAQ